MKHIKDLLFSLRFHMPRKVVYAVVGLLLVAARAKFNVEWLPDQDTLTDLVLALLAAHTATDIASLAGFAMSQYAAQKFGRNLAPKR